MKAVTSARIGEAVSGVAEKRLDDRIVAVTLAFFPVRRHRDAHAIRRERSLLRGSCQTAELDPHRLTPEHAFVRYRAERPGEAS